MASKEERPSKKARSSADKENTAVINDKESHKEGVCRFRITDVESSYGSKYGEDFYCSLVADKQGLYHLVDAAFQYQLNELSGGDRISSHLWKVTFAGQAYDSMELLPELGSVVCDEEHPRILKEFDLKKGQRGSFRGESGEFKFVLEDIHDDVSVSVTTQYPICEGITGPVITADPNAFYISQDGKQRAMVMRDAYQNYYNGDNDWRRDRDNEYDGQEHWIRCTPVAPKWSHKEDKVIGLFLKGGWKFKKSWTNGLQYALLHRAETATSGRWYQLRKERWYFIEKVGKGMSREEMIIQAKKLCKSMMEAALAKKAPAPRAKPKTFMEIHQRLREEKDFGAYEREMEQRYNHRRNERFYF